MDCSSCFWDDDMSITYCSGTDTSLSVFIIYLNKFRDHFNIFHDTLSVYQIYKYTYLGAQGAF